MNNDPSSQTLFGAAASTAATGAGAAAAAADVKAQSLKLKISTNQADGTSKVVPSNNSSSHDKNHHNHHHSKVAKDGSGVHKSSKSGNEVQKPKVSSHSSDKHKSHGDSNKSNSSFDKSAKPKDSSNSKPKENSHSSKDGKHSSKPKEGEKHKESGSITKPKPVSSSHNSSSSSNKIGDGKASLNNSMKDGHAKPKPNSSSSSNDKTSKPKEQVKSSSGEKHNSSMSSTKHSNPENKHKHSSSSSSKDAKTPNSSDKKKSSNDIKSGGDSSKHKSSEKGKESSDKHKHRDKENQEKEKLGLNMKQEAGGNKVVDKAKEQREKDKVRVKEECKPQPKVKLEVMSDEDVPLAMRKAAVVKKAPEVKVKQEKRDLDDESEDEPLASRLQKSRKVIKTEAKPMKKRRMESDDSEDEPIAKRMKKDQKNQQQKRNSQQSGSTVSPTKRKKEEEQEVWKWWEEEKKNDGSKWHSLEHKGPVFAPPYEPLPKNVKFGYNGKTMQLSESAEEVASMYAKFLEHEYTSKEAFNKNFFKDWRKMMTAEEREVITDLRKCDFRQMHKYFMEKNEERKNMTKEQKQVIKKQNEEMMKEYGFCIIDGHKEKIGNFKTEPPGLFRGRGEHPKMGMLKKRIMPEDVIINCSKSSKIPVPPPGHRWKEVRHDNTVTWLACWQENIQNQTKYIMLNPSSKLKGEKDWQKYETARKLKTCVDRIREQYRADWKSKEMKVRQRAVALYFIDKLALRAGNEKEEGETADTVGCCSLRVEHITLDEEKDGDENVVSFDFLGKDSIRYVNSVSVEKRVFKNLRLFMDNKQPGDDLFDRLNTTILNKHLNELMDGLTAKVFRTYNASKTLQEQLDLLTSPDDPLPAKLLSYNRANRAVAILCNHQRAVPKTFGKSMENLQTKINDKKAQVKEAQKDVKDIKKSCKNGRSDKDRTLVQKKEKALERLKEQLIKLELQATDKEENKQIALGTSKLNYLDPRISVAWCKKWNVPVEKIYNRTQRDKFRWAIEMAGPEFHF